DTIHVTEGEKKTLALSQLGLVAIGLGGVYSWKKKDVEELIPDLAKVDWKGKAVYVTFDFDPKPETRQYLGTAARRLARQLRKAGAKEVYEVQLPPGKDGAKVGVDDFLVAQRANGPEAFRRLVEEAQPVPTLSDFAPLTKTEGRTDTSNAARL